jgi:predicted GIY-YIG superfamily endonuclease
MWLEGHRTALYRFFDADGALLYVGITADVGQRWAAHERDKPWWPDVVTKTIEWHATRPAALAAELAAIKAEAPRYNVAGSPWAPGPRELEPHELNTGQAKDVLRGVERGAQVDEPLFIVDQSKARRCVAVLVSAEWYAEVQAVRAALGES